MTLTQGDKLSALWQRLEAHYTQRLADLRSRNDNPMSPEETATLRGRISECKAFLALAEVLPSVDPVDF